MPQTSRKPQSIVKIIYLPQIPVRSPRRKSYSPKWLIPGFVGGFFRGRIVKDPHYQDRPWISWKKAAICSKRFHLGHQQRSSTWKLNPPEVGERARFSSALGDLPRVGANMDRQLVWIDLIKTPRKHQIWLMLKAQPSGNTQRSGGEGWPYEASPA